MQPKIEILSPGFHEHVGSQHCKTRQGLAFLLYTMKRFWFAKVIRDKFNEVVNGVRCLIDSARLESANAAIKRIQAKACGLADAEYLFLKLRQIYS